MTTRVYQGDWLDSAPDHWESYTQVGRQVHINSIIKKILDKYELTMEAYSLHLREFPIKNIKSSHDDLKSAKRTTYRYIRSLKAEDFIAEVNKYFYKGGRYTVYAIKKNSVIENLEPFFSGWRKEWEDVLFKNRQPLCPSGHFRTEGIFVAHDLEENTVSQYLTVDKNGAKFSDVPRWVYEKLIEPFPLAALMDAL